MKKIAIVVVAYNRVKSLERLLTSLKKASYYGQEVPLIISIDNSGNQDVSSYAKKFVWPFGDKQIIEHRTRLGLRKHVLFCGNLSRNYDGVILLEDDLFVSQSFYNYATQTIEKYDVNNSIAGISLYTHLWNVGINRPFNPLHNGFDAYFLQYAQSWGQVWTKRMWEQFYDWYLKNEHLWSMNVNLPENVRKWPESSWLKYFISYVTKTNRYFVYPYISLTTNFTEAGTHNKVSNSNYQVPLLTGELKEFHLPDFNDDSLKYDVFFESTTLWKALDLPEDEVCIDLYGDKSNEGSQRYWLTSKYLNYRIIKEYALQLRPHELNIIYDLRGKGIFLYDTFEKGSNFKSNEKSLLRISQIRYDVKAVNKRSLFNLLTYELKESFKRKIMK